MKNIYLDNAATTALLPEVVETMVNAMNLDFGNPSSTHAFGRKSRGEIEDVRKSIARLTGVSSSEIIFTSCGTEANNLIIRSAVNNLGVKHIITSELEHKCVAETTKEMKRLFGVQLDYLAVDKNGDIDYAQLENLLATSKEKVLVTLMHANNEIGNIYDVHRIGKLCQTHGALFHSDMVQTLGHFPIDLNETPVDFVSSSAHKYHGPKGAGFAYIRKGTGLKAQITGGGQERNLRSGTENVHGILGMGKAFELALQNYENDHVYIQHLKDYTLTKLQEAFPEIKFNGRSAEKESLYTLLSILLPFQDKYIGFELDLKGIAASQGSACSSGASSVSNVLTKVLSTEEIKTCTPLRISFCKKNTTDEIDFLVATLLEIEKKQKARATK